MQEMEEGEFGFVVEVELEEWQEALYQIGFGDETEKTDEVVRKSVLKGLNKMKDGLQQQREGFVKEEEGFARIIEVVTNSQIRSLGPVLELLASARPSSSSQGTPSADTPSCSVCPPTTACPTIPAHPTTPACPSSSAETSTSVDPPTSSHPVTPLEVPTVSGPEGLSADSAQWKPIHMYVGDKQKYKAKAKIVDTSCPQLMQSKGIEDKFTQIRHVAHAQTANSHAKMLNHTLNTLLLVILHDIIILTLSFSVQCFLFDGG